LFKEHVNETRKRFITDSMIYLDKAVKINDSVSNLLYIRGMIKLYLELYEEAIEDFNEAIEKADDNISKYFFNRGLINSII